MWGAGADGSLNTTWEAISRTWPGLDEVAWTKMGGNSKFLESHLLELGLAVYEVAWREIGEGLT